METTPPARPTCSCGHDRYHHAVRPDFTYGVGAWLLLFSGASASPKSAVFRCGDCGEAFETTSSPEILHAFRRWPYVLEGADAPAPRP